MSKLESILFDSDEGPVSSLLRQGDTNADSPGAFIPFTDQSSESAPSRTQPQLLKIKNTVVPSSIDTMVFNSGTSPSMGQSPHSVVSDDKLSPQASMMTDKLREQLHKVQLELIEERAMRKRKDKSLIKLAKELTSRSVADIHREKKMEEVTETIRDLESRLLERNRTIQSELPKLQQQCLQYETDVRAQMALNEELRQQLNALLQERKRLPSMSQKEPVSRSTPTQTSAFITLSKDGPVYSAPIVDDDFHPIPASHSTLSVGTSVSESVTKRKMTKMNRSIFSVSLIFQASIVVGLVFLALVSVPNYRSNDDGTFIEAILDGFCAPALPGTTWTVNTSLITSHSGNSRHTMAYEAPWWAPSSMKVWAFQLVCKSLRARTRLESHKNVLQMYRLEDKAGELQSIPRLLWRGKVTDGSVVTVYPNSVAIHRQNNKWTKQSSVSINQAVVDYIKAPWSSIKKV
jgi:hypothetical protein